MRKKKFGRIGQAAIILCILFLVIVVSTMENMAEKTRMETGDNSSMGFWLTLLVTAITVAIVKRFRKKFKDR